MVGSHGGKYRVGHEKGERVMKESEVSRKVEDKRRISRERK